MTTTSSTLNASELAEIQEWFREKSANSSDGFSGEIAYDEPLSRHTYYRIGGPAAVLAFPKSISDLLWLKRAIQATSVRYAVIGAGSNLLVADSGYPGLVIRTNRLNSEIRVISGERPPLPCLDPTIRPVRIRTGGSVAISSLLRTAMQQGWGGLEFLCGIPGSVAGAVAMNAGTHLGEVKDRILRVESFDLKDDSAGELQIHEDPALRFEYRRNLFLPPSSVIFAAEWNLQFMPSDEVRATIERTLTRRKETQPINFPSCGSVFKNPDGARAWEVINKLGLRGHRVGDAQFSVKHSNFIVNLGNAKAADVRALIELARERARTELGLALEPEVRFLGSDETL